MRKNRIISLLMLIMICVTPLSVFADDDTCYGNPTSWDEWGFETSYGSHSWYYDYEYSEDPTCEEDGYDCYTCSYCYQSYYETVPATGHDWSAAGLVESSTRYDTLIWGQECTNDDCDKVRYYPIKIKKGKKKRLWTKKETKSLKKLTNRKIRWSSSKKKVATVKNGVVKARKKGTTYIKAKIWVKKYRTWVYIKYKVVVR